MLWTSILATDLLGLGLGAWLLWGGGRGRAPSWSADGRRWLWLAAGSGALTLAAGSFLGGGFLVLRLWCHLLFCVLVPLVIVRAAQHRGALGLALVVLGLLAEGAYVWARRIEPYRLQITRHALASERLAGSPSPREGNARALRIVVLADLQTDDLGAFEERVFAELDALRPDLVLIPGDLMQLVPGGSWERHERERAKLRALFGGLRHAPRLGLFMVAGDCEPRGARFDDCGVRMLVDEVVPFPDERLQLVGLSLRSARRPIDERFLAAARAFPGLTIVMGHAPEFALSAGDSDVPLLCLAGHTHGGQVQLPIFGPLLTLAHVPRSIAAGGLHRLGAGWVCVSRGIGMERNLAPRIRFLCPPELVVFELSGTEP